MSQDDVLFGYRLQLFDLAGRIGVVAACRTVGVERSTSYRWKREVDRHGLEVLRPRERRRPCMPNQLSALGEERIVAFALGHPGFGPRRIEAELARPRRGGTVVSARRPAPPTPGPTWSPAPAANRADAKPRGSSTGSRASYARPAGGWTAYSPTTARNGAASCSPRTLDRRDARVTRIRAGRPQTNGHVEALHRLILEECWRPAFARYRCLRFEGLERELAAYLREYNFNRAHNGRLSRGGIPAEIVYGAHKMETR